MTNPKAQAVFGELLRTYRGARSRADLADAVGVSENYIAQLESGRRNASMKLANRLAEELGLESDPRAAFLASAAGIDAGLATVESPQSPVGEALTRFLETTREEGGTDEALRFITGELIERLLNASVARGASRRERATLRGVEHLASALTRSGAAPKPNPTSHDQRVRQLENELLELLSHVADGTISIGDRIAMLKSINRELTSKSEAATQSTQDE